MSTFHLTLVTPEKLVLEEDVAQLNVATKSGEIGILPNHVELATLLVPGKLKVKKGEKAVTLNHSDGYLQVFKNTVTVFTERVE